MVLLWRNCNCVQRQREGQQQESSQFSFTVMFGFSELCRDLHSLRVTLVQVRCVRHVWYISYWFIREMQEILNILNNTSRWTKYQKTWVSNLSSSLLYHPLEPWQKNKKKSFFYLCLWCCCSLYLYLLTALHKGWFPLCSLVQTHWRPHGWAERWVLVGCACSACLWIICLHVHFSSTTMKLHSVKYVSRWECKAHFKDSSHPCMVCLDKQYCNLFFKRLLSSDNPEDQSSSFFFV